MMIHNSRTAKLNVSIFAFTFALALTFCACLVNCLSAVAFQAPATEGAFSAADGSLPVEPEEDFQLFAGVAQPIDDGKVYAAVFHRHFRLVDRVQASPSEHWKRPSLNDVPKAAPIAIAKQFKTLATSARPQSVEDLAKATVVVAGGEEDIFTAGAVMISRDGLAITNYHVAQTMAEAPMTVTTADGKAHPIVEFIAGDRDTDVALVRVQGEGFNYAPIAQKLPMVGAQLQMLHHSENRFYTYDRGYLMRYPMIAGVPHMEVSMNFAPGGSGCGIFDQHGHLVGLVSTIAIGDGPSLALASGLDANTNQAMQDTFDDEGFDDEGDPPILLVKHAVSLFSIRELIESQLSQLSQRQPKTVVKKDQPSSDLNRYEKNGLVVSVIAPKTVNPGSEFELKLDLDIPTGKHIYGAADPNSPTALSFKSDSGVKILDSHIPQGRPHRKTVGGVSYWLTNKQTISQKIKVASDSKGELSLSGALKFVVCDQDRCLPPATIEFTCTVPINVGTSPATTAVSAKFQSPVRLKAGGDTISVESPGYASPTMADMDGDGIKDLLVGQFTDGKVKVYSGLGNGEFEKGKWLEANGDVVSVPGVW